MEMRVLLIAVLGVSASDQTAFTQPAIAEAKENTIKFESTTDAFFSFKSRFAGTTIVTSNAIQVQIDSVVFTFPDRGRQDDPRHIEEYQVSLATRDLNSWRRISHSQFIPVQKELMSGQEMTLPGTNLTIALENISSRTNHWLVFCISHVSEKHPENGYSFSHTRRDLFTNLAPTTFQASQWTEMQQSPSSTRFIQQHWTNFPTVSFLKPTNGSETVFQLVKASEHVIGPFRGKYYSGVRFNAPAWMDGDFEFAIVHLYRNAQEVRLRPGYSWGLVAEQGQFYGLGEVERVIFKDLPETQARYPFTEKAYTAGAKLRHFVPGKTYALWQFHYWNGNEGVLPDFALAMTIVSERGRKEFGEITWR
jgi:hypothetical protein